MSTTFRQWYIQNNLFQIRKGRFANSDPDPNPRTVFCLLTNNYKIVLKMSKTFKKIALKKYLKIFSSGSVFGNTGKIVLTFLIVCLLCICLILGLRATTHTTPSLKSTWVSWPAGSSSINSSSSSPWHTSPTTGTSTPSLSSYAHI